MHAVPSPPANPHARLARGSSPTLRASPAFTLVELLVVVAVIAILMALVLPGLGRAKESGRGVNCLSNLRQFGWAWLIYADDHQGRLVPNCSFHDGNPGPSREGSWVQGWLDAETATPDNTNTVYLRESLLWPYLDNLDVWRCPSDHSLAPTAEGGTPRQRVRTVAMNKWLNCPRAWLPDEGGAAFRVARTMNDLTAPPPGETLVFVDERQDSINDGHFVVNMHATGAAARLVDFPASYHNGRGTVIFADGHAESKRWRDPRTRPVVEPGRNMELNISSEENPDVAWLQAHTTGLAP